MTENIGTKVKNLREAANLSLEDMVGEMDINTSQLELIEKGDVSPTISVLMKITRRLGVRLGTILDGAEVCAPVVTRSKGSQPMPSSLDVCEHLDYYPLAGNKRDRNMEPLIIDIEFVDKSSNRLSHEGEEFMYVLEGELNLIYGTENYSLKQGDSIYYDSIVPHVITTPSETQKAKVLAVTYTPF